MEQQYFNEKQAAKYSGSTVYLLRRWRLSGGGFPFIKTGSGSIRYSKVDIDKYMEANTQRSVKTPSQENIVSGK